MANPIEIELFILVLAFLMGFVANRTTLCAVRAVDEIITKHQANILLSFFRVMLWSLVVALLMPSFVNHAREQDYLLTMASLTGGFLFGIGAVINRGCALHTLCRFGTGDFAMLATIVGLVSGAVIIKQCQQSFSLLAVTPAAFDFAVPEYLTIPIALVVLTFLLAELAKHMAKSKFSTLTSTILASRYDLRSAAAILGIGNGILFVVIGPWTYTNTIIQSVTNLLLPDSAIYLQLPLLRWWLLLALIMGITVSALAKAQFNLLVSPTFSWLKHFTGGIFMGFGATLIPGGNDALLLNAMPGLSPHALPAYLSMLLAIALYFFVNRRYRQKVEVI